MKLAGRRFWTWMSVAVLSLFVKSEMNAGLQDKPTNQGAATPATAANKAQLGTHKTLKGMKIKTADKRGYKLASKHAPAGNKAALKEHAVKKSDSSSPKLSQHKIFPKTMPK